MPLAPWRQPAIHERSLFFRSATTVSGMTDEERPLSSEDMIRQARQSLQSGKPDMEVPDLETEIDVQVDFEEIAEQEPERRLQTGRVPRPQRPSRVDRALPTSQPHERTRTGRGVMVAVLAWIVLLGIGIAILAMSIEGP